MWNSRILIENEWMPVIYQEINDRPPSIRDVLEPAKGLLEKSGAQAPLKVIESLADESPVPGADGIAYWGEKAVGEYHNSGEEVFEIHFNKGALWMESGETNPRAVVAWQDNTAVAVAFPAKTEKLELSYDDSLFNEQILENARCWLVNKEFDESSFEEQTFLEWRIYTGTDSGVFDGVISFAKKAGQRVVQIAAHGSGLLVGSVVRILSAGSHRVDNDPLWPWNLHRLENNHPITTTKFPRLKGASPPSAAPVCMVIVHGTFSCGIKIAVEIEHIKPCVPIYRYEHDTFRQITENGRELARLVRSLKCPRVLLVAHSRGGLVACAAAIDLKLQNEPVDVEIWTYGTPHDGTPLVEAGHKALGWLYRLGTDLVNGIAVPVPLQWAISYFLGTAGLPPGIEAMAPGCGFLGAHQAQVDYLNIKSFGGTIDHTMTKKTVTGQAFVSGLAATLFGGKPNDLVVPYDSAIWPNRHGSNIAVADCAHTQFFEQKKIRNQIAAYGCPKVRDYTGRIVPNEDELIIGGVRLPIRQRK